MTLLTSFRDGRDPMPHFDRAVDLALGAHEPSVAAELRLRQGNLLLRAGDADKATAALGSAVKLFRDLNDGEHEEHAIGLLTIALQSGTTRATRLTPDELMTRIAELTRD